MRIDVKGRIRDAVTYGNNENLENLIQWKRCLLAIGKLLVYFFLFEQLAGNIQLLDKKKVGTRENVKWQCQRKK